MPPPPPPPPSLNKLNNNSIKSSKKEPTDVNALLSQIRQGAKLKKVKNVNDRSSPVVAGSVNKTNDKESTAKPITPSMFKNGAIPLNINFKIPQFGNQSAVKINKQNTSIKSTPNKSPTNLNNQNSYTKTLPSKFSAKNNSDRPSIKPPPLPLKPPGINRRESFDSGQIINVLQSNSLNSSTNSSTNSSVSDTNNGIKTHNVKPLPPPRNTNISFQTMKQIPAPAPPTIIPQFKSTQNLTTLNSNNSALKNNTPGFSTLRVKTNGKNYTSTPRPPIGPPPPPPINKNNNKVFSNNQSNNSFSLSSLQISSPLAPAPPPPSSPPPPPPPPPSSLTLASMGNLNNYNSNFNTIEPTVIKNSSKDLESRFHKQFRDISYLPAPEPFTNCKKIYSASLGKPKFKQRSRAPDPPNFNQTGFSTPILNF